VADRGVEALPPQRPLQEAFPGRSYAIFEARGELGGTWDLARGAPGLERLSLSL
jgi:hypothetical protein